MCKMFLHFLRRHLRRLVYPVGVANFYGSRCRVYCLFSGHLWIARCMCSSRIIIEIV